MCFHAQQCAEKALKAWLTWLGVVFPRTHDLTLLLNLLAAQGVDPSPFADLIEYNPYAVLWRYESFGGSDEPLDRPATIARVERLLAHVSAVCAGEADLL